MRMVQEDKPLLSLVAECIELDAPIVWDPSMMEWRNGPSLSVGRANLVAVVCHNKVYAIGGYGGDNNYHGYTILDTIESIQVSSLLEMTETMTTTRQNNSQWTRLQCHLSSP